ncbi:DNA alkylation repair protein [Candidatus Saccharibacteria bacterium]|nr:DNA alkylation repair protein [Candidatus Saccharibacteria bacterium]
MYQQFQTELISYADDEYRQFSMRGIPCERPFLGVRIPDIRRLVGKIKREDFEEFLGVKPVAFEEVIARGFLIGRLDYNGILEYFDSQIEYLDNWCSVDTFCSALRKKIEKNRDDFLDKKIESLLKSDNEFATRTGLVFLLDFYVSSEYLQLIFDRIESLKTREEYYVKMALAWLVAECFIKFPEETFSYMIQSELDDWTFNKAISKICDSRRVEPDIKAEIKRYRRRETQRIVKP